MNADKEEEKAIEKLESPVGHQARFLPGRSAQHHDRLHEPCAGREGQLRAALAVQYWVASPVGWHALTRRCREGMLCHRSPKRQRGKRFRCSLARWA